jgi:hypothetical protein
MMFIAFGVILIHDMTILVNDIKISPLIDIININGMLNIYNWFNIRFRVYKIRYNINRMWSLIMT